MFLIQILLPVAVASRDRDEVRQAFATTREELVKGFGGVTAYSQSPAEGVWTAPEGDQQQDRMVMVEVVAPTLDRAWWRPYSRRLAERFAQEIIHIRAMTVELIDDRAV